MNDFIIQIDNREQTPWTWDKSIKTEKATLKTADYRIKGDTSFGIERKGNDFLLSIGTNWNRLCREIGRMDNWNAKVFIVENNFVDFFYTEIDGKIISPNHQSFKLSPKFISKRIAELTLMNVSILFCDNHDLGSAMALALFKERWRQLNDIKRNN